eukprot:1129869-Prorocentrum_lima.AAC.1
MTSSLVGSEMCIRDSNYSNPIQEKLQGNIYKGGKVGLYANPVITNLPVSYTHLTLPTICSV